jgi:hypothetical protein
MQKRIAVDSPKELADYRKPICDVLQLLLRVIRVVLSRRHERYFAA